MIDQELAVEEDDPAGVGAAGCLPDIIAEPIALESLSAASVLNPS